MHERFIVVRVYIYDIMNKHNVLHIVCPVFNFLIMKQERNARLQGGRNVLLNSSLCKDRLFCGEDIPVL